MGEEPESRMQLSDVKRIDSLSKLTTGFVVLLYASGFLITSLHSFHFGYTAANPFRPRILTAGSWFLLLAFIPCALSEQLAKRVSKEGLPWWEMTAKWCWLYFASYNALQLLLGRVFTYYALPEKNEKPLHWDWHLILIVACLALLSLVLFVIVAPVVTKKRWLGSALAGAFAAFQIYSGIKETFFSQHFTANTFNLWMIGLSLLWLIERRAKISLLEAEDWLRRLVMVFVAILIFSTVYYPHLKSAWGGGEPLAVTVLFSKDSLILHNKELSCLWLDETDAGYYLLGKDEDRATFLPKSAIAAIRFTDHGSGVFSIK